MINDMIVGMENLPNVFIDKIAVYPRENDNGYKLIIRLCMYDATGNNASWKGKIDDLKIKVSFVSVMEEISGLNSGEISLFDYEPNQTRTRVFSANSFYKLETIENYDKFTLILEEILPFFPSDLNIYAAGFIDGLDFGISMFDKFYGPMSGEQVFAGGQLYTLSNYFYYPDTNEEYGGPVHLKPDGSYMEGSAHTEEPHKEVVLVSEENYKIVDNFELNVQDLGDSSGGLSSSDMAESSQTESSTVSSDTSVSSGTTSEY